MYLTKSLIDGLKILGFDKQTILKVSKEKSLEEIFLSTLFLNYLIVLIAFFIALLSADIQTGSLVIKGMNFNMPVLFGLLMVYPFIYNVIVYFLYSFFGLVSEMLSTNKKIKPLISVGFHTAIVYSILIYVIALLSVVNPSLGIFLSIVFVFYFILTMFFSISTIYNYSPAQTLIILFVPLIVIFSLLLLTMYFVEPRTILGFFLN